MEKDLVTICEQPEWGLAESQNLEDPSWIDDFESLYEICDHGEPLPPILLLQKIKCIKEIGLWFFKLAD